MSLPPDIAEVKALVAAGSPHPRTANEFVGDTLRGAIIQGTLKEGTALHQDELAAAFGVSRIPVREALIRLEGEGLIEFVPRKGAVVAGLSPQEVLELSDMRVMLEISALRLSLPRLLDHDLVQCERILDQMEREPDMVSQCSLHLRFHLGLYGACERKRLLAIIGSLMLRMGRYFRVMTGPLSYRRQGEREHRELLQVCRNREVIPACEILERHILSAAERFTVFLKNRDQAGTGR